jgi:hypothetical protein
MLACPSRLVSLQAIWAESGQVVCKEAERSAQPWNPPGLDYSKHRKSLDKFSGLVQQIRQEDVLQGYPHGYLQSLSMELIRTTYSEDILGGYN